VPAEDEPIAEFRRVIEVNLNALFLLSQLVGRQMLAQGSGSIILTATTDALIGCAGLDAYTAAHDQSRPAIQ